MGAMMAHPGAGVSPQEGQPAQSVRLKLT
jgi:hypothetical protein